MVGRRPVSNAVLIDNNAVWFRREHIPHIEVVTLLGKERNRKFLASAWNFEQSSYIQLDRIHPVVFKQLIN